jgi:hypothetical protein
MVMPAAARTPTCLWAQDRTKIYLTIQVTDCTAPVLDLQEKSIAFEGVSSDIKYAFSLPLMHAVKNWHQTVTSRCIVLTAEKVEVMAEFWPRINSGGKLAWIKTDFSRYQSGDDESDGEPAAPAQPNMMDMVTDF